MYHEDNAWFGKRYYGWGTNTPKCWQGWLVTIAYPVLLGLGARLILERKPASYFFAYATVLTAALIAVDFWKGGSLRPRSGSLKLDSR
jgi:hypothetical protein